MIDKNKIKVLLLCAGLLFMFGAGELFGFVLSGLENGKTGSIIMWVIFFLGSAAIIIPVLLSPKTTKEEVRLRRIDRLSSLVSELTEENYFQMLKYSKSLIRGQDLCWWPKFVIRIRKAWLDIRFQVLYIFSGVFLAYIITCMGHPEMAAFIAGWQLAFLMIWSILDSVLWAFFYEDETKSEPKPNA